jgi:hypothetical protein
VVFSAVLVRINNLIIRNHYREPLETPVGLPEVSAKGRRRKSLIPCNVKNYDKAIFSIG